MAETPYSPSTSGFSSDSWFVDMYDYYYEYNGRNAWSTATSTMIQGSVLPAIGEQGTVNCNYYGIAYFDFASIRTTNLTYYPVRIRLRMKSKTSSTRTIYIHMGKGMSKDSYVSGTRPVNADTGDGTTLGSKTVTCSANSWCELNTTDTNWLKALVDSDTTCFYINHLSSGTTPTDSGYYCEFNGASTDDHPILYIDWEVRNTPPNPPSSISITSTGFGTNGNVGGVTSISVTCGAASDSQDAETSLLYQFEYSISGGAYSVLQSWVYSKSATLSLSGIPDYALIQFRVAAKDTGGLTSSYVYSSNYAYKIGAPSAPTSCTTPSTITTNSMSLSWGASSSYDSSVGVHYTIMVYDARYGWVNAAADYNGTSVSVNTYTVLSLDEVNLQYFNYSSQLRVKALFAQSVQGQILESSYTLSGGFTIDLHHTPTLSSFSINYTGTAKAYEGVNYDVTITKDSWGNGKDAYGNSMQWNYRIDILYGSGYSSIRNIYQSANLYWASLPNSVTITIPSNIITTLDISAKIRVSITDIIGQSSHPTDSDCTLKRYRSPTIDITTFTREETEFSITFSILDTGLNDQTTAYIASAVATADSGLGGANHSYTFAGSLTGLILTFNSDDDVTAVSYGIVTLVVINKPDDSMAAKTVSVSQQIPQYLPLMRIKTDGTGTYFKYGAFEWDETGIPYRLLRSDGWLNCNETWTYVNATSVTISGDVSNKYKKGDKIRYKQGGEWKYNNIISSPAYNSGTGLTTITTHSGYISSASDCSFANSIITDNFYSHIENPLGFPASFKASAPIYSGIDNGSGGQPTTTETRFIIRGGSVKYFCRIYGLKVSTDYVVSFVASGLVPSIDTTKYTGRACIGSALSYANSTNYSCTILYYKANGTIYILYPSNVTDNATIDDISYLIEYEY